MSKPLDDQPLEDVRRRKAAIARLLIAYGETSRERAEMYLGETAEIPLDKLENAIVVLIREHVWPRVPLIADIWAVARKLAGIGRAQYRPGASYVTASGWPPAGKRHGAHPGEYETALTHPGDAILRIAASNTKED